MKIYFAGSIRGGRDTAVSQAAIIEELTKYGTVLTEHIGNLSLTDGGEKHISNEEIFERDMSWVREAGVIVAEVSTPSLGVGYEIGQAVAMGKPVLCLYQTQEGKRLSAMIDGNNALRVHHYADLASVHEELAAFFKSRETEA